MVPRPKLGGDSHLRSHPLCGNSEDYSGSQGWNPKFLVGGQLGGGGGERERGAKKQFTSNLVWKNLSATHYVTSKQIIHVYFQLYNIFNESCDFLKYIYRWFICLPRSRLKEDYSKTSWRKTMSGGIPILSSILKVVNN